MSHLYSICSQNFQIYKTYIAILQQRGSSSSFIQHIKGGRLPIICLEILREMEFEQWFQPYPPDPPF